MSDREATLVFIGLLAVGFTCLFVVARLVIKLMELNIPLGS